MTTIGKTISIKGEMRAAEDITVDGRIDGHLHCEGFAVVLKATAEFTGDIIARDITVFGHTSGQLVATDVVDIRPDAVVKSQVISAQFILNEGAQFQGRVEPQHLEAALRVAKFNRQKRDAAAS
jgi:cytoskeletal protein CcmA (bactofilin family)